MFHHFLDKAHITSEHVYYYKGMHLSCSLRLCLMLVWHECLNDKMYWNTLFCKWQDLWINVNMWLQPLINCCTVMFISCLCINSWLNSVLVSKKRYFHSQEFVLFLRVLKRNISDGLQMAQLHFLCSWVSHSLTGLFTWESWRKLVQLMTTDSGGKIT